MASFNNKMSLFLPRCDTRSLPRREYGETNDQFETKIKTFIADKFNKETGKVERVDLVPKETPEGYVYYMAFIHFDYWCDRPDTRFFQNQITNKDAKAKFHFSPKWFWIVNENENPLSEKEVELNKKIWELEQALELSRKETQAAKVAALFRASPDDWRMLQFAASEEIKSDDQLLVLDQMFKMVDEFLPAGLVREMSVAPSLTLSVPPHSYPSSVPPPPTYSPSQPPLPLGPPPASTDDYKVQSIDVQFAVWPQRPEDAPVEKMDVLVDKDGNLAPPAAQVEHFKTQKNAAADEEYELEDGEVV